MEDLKNKQYKNLLGILAGGAYAFVLFIAVHVATLAPPGSGKSFFDVLLPALNNATTHPFAISLNANTLWYAFMATLLFAFAICLLYYDNIINGPGEKNPMGSAKWNTNWKAYNKKYTDPPKSPANDGPKNMILTQNIF